MRKPDPSRASTSGDSSSRLSTAPSASLTSTTNAAGAGSDPSKNDSARSDSVSRRASGASPHTGRHQLPIPLTPSSTPLFVKSSSSQNGCSHPSSSASTLPSSSSFASGTKLSRSISSGTYPAAELSASSRRGSRIEGGGGGGGSGSGVRLAGRGEVEEGGSGEGTHLDLATGRTGAGVAVEGSGARAEGSIGTRTRPQSMRSISTHGGGTSTASPLVTPADGPIEDPLIMATIHASQAPTTSVTAAAGSEPSAFLDVEEAWNPASQQHPIATKKPGNGWGQTMIKSGSDDGGKSDAFFRRTSAVLPTRSFTPSTRPASGDGGASIGLGSKQLPALVRKLSQGDESATLDDPTSNNDIALARKLLATSEPMPGHPSNSMPSMARSDSRRPSTLHPSEQSNSPSFAAPLSHNAGDDGHPSSDATVQSYNSTSDIRTGTQSMSHQQPHQQLLPQQQQQQQQQQVSFGNGAFSNTPKMQAFPQPNDPGMFLYGHHMPNDLMRPPGHQFFTYPVTPLPTGPAGIGMVPAVMGSDISIADEQRFGAMRPPQMPSWGPPPGRPPMQSGQHSHQSSVQSIDLDPNNPHGPPLPIAPNFSPHAGWNVQNSHHFGHPGHSPTWSTGSVMGSSRPTTSASIPSGNNMNHRRIPTGPGMPPNVGPPFPTGQVDAFYPGSPALSSHSGAGFGGHSRIPSMHSVFSPQHSRSPSVVSQMGNSNQMNYSRGLPTGFTFAGGPVVDLTQQRPAPNRSPLLEEFRSRGTRRRLDLIDIRGHVVEFSSDQYGSRFTQEKLDSASDEERQLVFDEILLSAREVMNDVFGNYVVQKLFEFGTPQQRTLLVDQMHGYVVQLSLCTYGCRVVQRALECVPLSQKLLLSTELEPQVLTCVKDQNANHVVQKLLERLPPEAVDFVPRAFQGNVQALASHCYSCRVLQRVFEHCRADQSRPLLDELMQQPSIAMEDQYGNYVMQWIILHGAEVDRTGIIQVTKGNMLRLSMHKFASNVVEEVVRHAPDIDREELIEETMKPVPARPSAQSTSATTMTAIGGHSGDTTEIPVLIMMRDQYGNYVVQRLLEHARGTQRERLIAIVRPFLQHMKRFTSGFTKHLNAIERLLDTPGHNTVRVSTGTSTEDLAAKASTALSISDNFNETHLPTLTPAPTNP